MVHTMLTLVATLALVLMVGPLPMLLTLGPAPTRVQDGVAVLLAAGDIATCNGRGDEATAELLDRLDGTVATLGDNVYPSGTAQEFAACYGPSWGHHKERTRPAPGNHEYKTRNAAGYFGYFGAAAGDPDEGWYSYDLGNWHVIALNSNCAEVGGCEAGSPQGRWLRADLAAHPAACTLAYWHQPRFSSGAKHGSDKEVRGLWKVLYAAGADVVLSGHDHVYERFAPRGVGGEVDPERGIRQFVVGTGGASPGEFDEILPASEARSSDAFGVLKLTLGATAYAWAFVPVDGETFSDAGTATCH